jgi:carboxylesterase type B
MVETSTGWIERAVETEHATLDNVAAAHTSALKGAFANARATLSAAATAHKEKARESRQAQGAWLKTWKVQSGAAARAAATVRADRERTMSATHAGQAAQDADKAATGSLDDPIELGSGIGPRHRLH